MEEIDHIIRAPKKAEVKYERAWVKLSDLKTDSTNPNIMTEAQEKALDYSIEKYGYVDLIVVDKNTMMIANGEHRVKRLMAQGVTEAEVVLFPFKDDEDRRLFRQVANKLHGQHDETLDVEEFRKIIDAGLNLELKGLLGMSEREMNKILDSLNGDSEEDEVPPPPRIAKSKTGELYILGRHRLLVGDATKAEDVARLMDGKKADMVFTDPPYGVGYEYNQIEDVSGDEYFQFTKKWFNNVLKNTNNIIITAGCNNLRLWLKDIQDPHHIGVWTKTNALTHGRVTHYWAWEPILFYGDFKKKRANDVFNFPIGKQVEVGGHTCPKPLELIVDIIQNFSEQNELILDVFGGSGTTLVACDNYNRICYMMEIDPVYIDVIIQRWQNLTHQNAVRSDGVEWDTIKAYKGVDDKE